MRLLHDLRVVVHLAGGSGHWIHVCRRILGCDPWDAHRASLTLALTHLLLAQNDFLFEASDCSILLLELLLVID